MRQTGTRREKGEGSRRGGRKVTGFGSLASWAARRAGGVTQKAHDEPVVLPTVKVIRVILARNVGQGAELAALAGGRSLCMRAADALQALGKKRGFLPEETER